MTSDEALAVDLGSKQVRHGPRESAGEEAVGSQYAGNHWPDEQLDAMLSEPATWTVNGRNDQVLCTVRSPRQALDRAASLVAFGADVTGVCRMPGANIIAPRQPRIPKLFLRREQHFSARRQIGGRSARVRPGRTCAPGR